MTREKKILFEICFFSNNLFNDLKECDLAMGGFLKFPVDTLLSLNTMSIKNPFQLDKYFVSDIVDKKNIYSTKNYSIKFAEYAGVGDYWGFPIFLSMISRGFQALTGAEPPWK